LLTFNSTQFIEHLQFRKLINCSSEQPLASGTSSQQDKRADGKLVVISP
jgi:hypothetical protein